MAAEGLYSQFPKYRELRLYFLQLFDLLGVALAFWISI